MPKMETSRAAPPVRRPLNRVCAPFGMTNIPYWAMGIADRPVASEAT